MILDILLLRVRALYSNGELSFFLHLWRQRHVTKLLVIAKPIKIVLLVAFGLNAFSDIFFAIRGAIMEKGITILLVLEIASYMILAAPFNVGPGLTPCVFEESALVPNVIQW